MKTNVQEESISSRISNHKNIKNGLGYSNDFDVIKNDDTVAMSYKKRVCFGNIGTYSNSNYKYIILYIKRNLLIVDIDFINKYVEEINNSKVFCNIVEIDNSGKDLSIKIEIGKTTKNQLLATLTILRYLYEHDHDCYQRSIPVWFMYIRNKYTNLSFLQCLYIAHYNNFFKYINCGHSLYSGYKKTPQFKNQAVRDFLLNGLKGVTGSFESSDKKIDLPLYDNEEELEELITKNFK